MNKKIIVIGLILVLLTTVFSGCLDDNTEPNNDKNNENNNAKTYTINTNYPRDRLGLNSDGEAAFTAACNKYTELKSSMTDEEARTALVDELNNDFEFVKEASLSEDGYTIAVIFEDDTAALMITYRDLYPEDESVSTGSQFSSYNNEPVPVKDSNLNNKITEVLSKEKLLTPLASEIDSSNQCEVDFIVPQSKKVLIINALSLCAPSVSSSHVRKVEKAFKEKGWTTDDIDIKERSSLNDGNLTPDDYFDYSGYGFVVYMGHGGYCSGYEGSIPGHHYIECCDYVDFTTVVGKERYDQYLSWRDQGRLILGGYYNDRAETEWVWEYYIDTDLIMEKAQIDPGTIIYTCSCNSYRAADAYLNNDAGCFFGWDYKADVETSGDVFYELVKGMAGEGVSQNGADALNELSDELRTSEVGGVLQIYDNDKNVYLPCFGKLVLQPDSPPSGTSYYELEFSPYGATIEAIKVNAGEEIEYDGVSPVNTTITIKAKGSTGIIVETGIVKPELISGENDLLTIKSWDTYGIILKADPISVKADGEETSTITATLKAWRDTDVLEPTGAPIICREVEFITSLGFFIGSEKVFTDKYGKATVELASNNEGTATISAIVEDDWVESYKDVDVTFGDLAYSFKLVDRIIEEASGWNGQNTVVVYGWRYWLVFQGTPNVEYYKITIHLNGHQNYENQQDHEEHITQGIMPSTSNGWLTTQEAENWTADYNKGYRFFEIAGVDHYSYEAGVTDVGSKQNEYYSNMTKWTFEIVPYTG